MCTSGVRVRGVQLELYVLFVSCIKKMYWQDYQGNQKYGMNFL